MDSLLLDLYRHLDMFLVLAYVLYTKTLLFS